MTEPININSAPAEDLTALPGVGPAMAERIVSARPFDTIDDLRQIRGIGPALLDRLTPLITVVDPAHPEDTIILEAETGSQPEAGEESIGDESPSETESEPLALEDEPIPPWDGSESGTTQPEIPMPKEKAIVPVEVEDQEDEEGDDPSPKNITWNQALLLVGISGVVSFILAVLLSLGIISSINGGLRFGSDDEIIMLSSQAESLNLQLQTISQDVTSLRSRVDNLEGINSRVSDLEILMDEIDKEMDTTKD